MYIAYVQTGMISLRDEESESSQANGRAVLSPKELMIYHLAEMRGEIYSSVLFSVNLNVGVISTKANELIDQLRQSDDSLFSTCKIDNEDGEAQKISEYYYAMY